MSDEHKEQTDGGHGSGGSGHGGGGSHGPPHGGGAHEEHEGAPEWLISFADNVALMMGFFVILLAMNMEKPKAGGLGGQAGPFPGDSDTPAQEDFALAMRAAFNNPVDISSKDPREASLVRRLKQRQNKGETARPGPDGDRHDAQTQRTSDFTNITGYITFGENDTGLADDSLRTIQAVAEQLRGTRWIVEVRGHVSSLETMRDREHAVRLGFDRAYAAAAELVRDGVRWEQLRVVSCADNERATPLPADKAGHANNQRAEVVVTQETMPADPYSSGSVSGGSAQPGKQDATSDADVH